MNTDEQGRGIENSSLVVNNTKCPKCGSTEFELKNYSMMWHDGDIHCARCGEFIRRFDAG
jgi:uncharacterized Zn finger protein (UPF0148 family)